MADRAPSNIPLLPVLDYESIDPRKAAPSSPHTADMTQHALATAGRHAGTSIGLYLVNGNTASIIVPVPPSVTHMRYTFYIQGMGTVVITSTNDTTGQTFIGNGANTEIPAGLVLKQTNPYGYTGGLKSPMKVRSSAAWTWTTETVTIAFATSSIASGAIHSICFEPIWNATAV